MGANRSSSKVSEHLGYIYDLLNNLQTQITNEANTRAAGVQNALNKAVAAQRTADGKADANHNHDSSYAKKNHHHNVHYSMTKVRIDGKNSTDFFVNSLATGGSYVSSTSNEV